MSCMQISILETFTRHQPETLSLCGRWRGTQIKFSGAVGLRGTETSLMQLCEARIKSLWLARCPAQGHDLAPPKRLQAAMLSTSQKSTSKTGTQSQPPASTLLQAALSSQTAPNSTWRGPAVRGERLSSAHRSAGTSPSHQEAHTSPWTNLTHHRGRQRKKRGATQFNRGPATGWSQQIQAEHNRRVHRPFQNRKRDHELPEQEKAKEVHQY